MEVTFVTGNPAKAKYLSEYFNKPIKHQKLYLEEIQSLDLQKIVEDKARRAFEIAKTPVLVEDVSLTFTALKKLPGPLIKWFLETLGNEGLCRLLDSHDDRSAVAEVRFALFDGSSLHTFVGRKEGIILEKPRGEESFGWDPIFVPNGSSKTYAEWKEMTKEELEQTSLRIGVLREIAEFLEKN